MTRQEGQPHQVQTIPDNELQAAIYFAVGVASEGSVRGRNVAYELAFAGYVHDEGDRARHPPLEPGTFRDNQLEPIYNSGYSLGTLQTDFGQQRNHPTRNADQFLNAYQEWAGRQAQQRPELALTPAEFNQASQGLRRQGNEIRGDAGTASDNGYDIPSGIRTRLNAFLASDDGITYVHGQDVAQVNHLLRTGGAVRQLQATTLYQNATQDDQVRMATVMAKLENQDGSRHWPGVIRQINDGGINSLEGIKASVPRHLHGDRDNALRGAELLIELRNADDRNPLQGVWRDVAANPLVNPTQLGQDRAHPDLEAEYSTVKNLFMVSAQARPFVRALDDGGQRAQEVRFAGAPQGQTAGLYVSGDDFVQWNRDGHGYARVGGQWSRIERDIVERVPRGNGVVDLSITREGVSTRLLHVDPRAPALHQEGAPHQPHPAAPPMRPNEGGAGPDQRQRIEGPRGDTPLHRQAEAAVRDLDASLGRGYDSASERMTASLASLARMHGLERIDRVVLSVDNGYARAGENVFVMQGESSDPSRRLAHMKTQDAVGTPLDQSLAQYQAWDQRQAERPLVATNEQAPELTGHRLRV